MQAPKPQDERAVELTVELPAAAPQRSGPLVEDELVDRLAEAYAAGPRSMQHIGAYELPQMTEVVRCLDDVRALLFPGFVGGALADG